MLRRDSNLARDGQRHWTAEPNGAIKDALNPPQISTAEGGQAVLKYLTRIAALVNAACPHRPALNASAFIHMI